ncbi:MAG: PEGA domain-containing protein [Candidatus Daviesbacteria bacterium]|nr:MAG: PEGA domain-containing protein [Candidatus Daviesbacteria bacterium]
MKKTFFVLLITLSFLVVSWRFLWPAFLSVANLQAKSGVKVLSSPEKATVYINDQKKGESPYEETNLSAGDYLIKIEEGEASWQRRVKLTSGTLTVINRQLNKDSEAGEILTLEEGRGVTIIASPTISQVEIDGKKVGPTPLKLDLPSGEHTFVISQENYQPRTIRANVPQRFNLILSVDLKLEETNLVSNTTVSTSPPAIKLKVLTTPTGFLRVRDKPSLQGQEIGRVNTGDELEAVEESTSWDKIKTSTGLEGYVSKTYVEKK